MAYFNVFKLYNEMARVINLITHLGWLIANIIENVGSVPREEIVKHFLSFDHYLEKNCLITRMEDNWLILENYPEPEELVRIQVDDNPYKEFQKFLNENYPGLIIVETCWFDLEKKIASLELTTKFKNEKMAEIIFNEFSEDIGKMSEVCVDEIEANDDGGYLEFHVKANLIP